MRLLKHLSSSSEFCLAPSEAAQDFRDFVKESLLSDDSTELHESGLFNVDTSEVGGGFAKTAGGA
jgi:hypothetical protein